MRNRWGVEIKKGYHAWYRGGRDGTEEGDGTVLNVDTRSDYAKAYGPIVYIRDDAGPIHVSADAIYQVLPPMKLKPGGVVTAGLSIYDTMQYIQPKVATLCIGQAASMGSLLLTAGEAGMRYATPNARIMIHQPSGGFRGQASDIEIHAQEILSLRRKLNDMYVKHTGQKLPIIEKAMDRDNFMAADAALKFGLIDKIVENRGDAEAKKK